MELNVEKVGQAVAKVSFSVPAEEFAQEVTRGLRQAGRSVQLKGFRPGKVPAHVIEKRHGDQIRQEVRETFLRRAYQRAIEEEDLEPMAHPRIDRDDLALDESGALTAEFEIALRPTFELPDYRGYRFENRLQPVTDDDVTQAIQEVKRGRARPEPVGEDGLAEDGMILADVAFLHGEDVVFERESLRLSASTPPPGVEPEAFKNALLGANVDSVVELDVTLPVFLDNEEARGKPGKCRITVKQAFDMILPSDEEVRALIGAETEEELLTKVREQLEESAQKQETSRIESELLDRVLAETSFELPASILEQQTNARLAQLHERMRAQGVADEQIHEQREEQRETAREEAEKGMRALLVVEALGKKEGLLVTDGELQAELLSIAERNNAEVEEVRRYYAENNLGQQMAIEILERKVRTFLRESATT